MYLCFINSFFKTYIFYNNLCIMAGFLEVKNQYTLLLFLSFSDGFMLPESLVFVYVFVLF